MLKARLTFAIVFCTFQAQESVFTGLINGVTGNVPTFLCNNQQVYGLTAGALVGNCPAHDAMK
jgi:hypothetical protein